MNESTTLLKYMRCVMRNLPHIYKLQILKKKTIKTLKIEPSIRNQNINLKKGVNNHYKSTNQTETMAKI